MEKLNRYYPSIDLWKFICAILVVFLHTVNSNTDKLNPGLESSIRLIGYHLVWSINPVEFFFITSSFFLFLIKLNFSRVRNYVKRLIILYFIWSVVYLIPAIHSCFKEVQIVDGIIKLLRKIFFIGTMGHMWYVLALIYSIILLYPFLRNRHIKAAWIMSIVMYGMVLLGESYFNIVTIKIPMLYAIVEKLKLIFGNLYLFRGPIFVMIGYTIATNYSNSRRTIISIWLLCALLCNMELIAIKYFQMGVSYSTTIIKPLAATTFFMCVLYSDFSVNNKITRFLGKSSSIIYFSHIAIRNALDGFIGNMYILWFVIVILGIILGLILEIIRKEKNLMWVRYLY